MNIPNLLKKLLIIACSASLILTGCGTAKNTSAGTQSDTSAAAAFAELTDEIFKNAITSDSLSLNYTLKDPSGYGIEMDEATWGDIPLTEEDFNENKAELQTYLDRLNEISGLEGRDAVDYDVLKYYLEMNLESCDYIYHTSNLKPLIGFPSQLPITMAEYHFDSRSDVDDYLVLLNSLGDYMSQIIQFENQKADAGYGMCRAALEQSIEDYQAFIQDPENNLLIDVFPENLSVLSDLSEDEKNTYIEKNKTAVLNAVIPAYQALIDCMTAQLDTAPENGSLSAYNQGRDYYKHLLKASVGTDKTPEELIELTESKLNSALFSLALIANNNADIFDQVMAANYAYSDPTEIIEHFKSTFTSEQMPPASEVNYTLKTVHESMADSLSPAMYLIPRLDDTANNQIYLNLNENSGNELMPTLAHEGYPGHMFQFVYYYNTQPNPIRTVYENSAYSEGWAAYVEGLSYQYCGFSEDVADYLSTYSCTFMLNFYCRIDLGIHYEGWSYDDTKAFITPYLPVDDDTVRQIYDAILFNPTNYLIYGIGMDEIVELRENTEKNLDEHFDVKEFHKTLLDLGPAPFPILLKYMPDAQPEAAK